MDEASHDMLARELPEAAWRKSHYSNPSGNCVELAMLPVPCSSAPPTRSPRSSGARRTATSMASSARRTADTNRDVTGTEN
jgi:hypothetical protein